MPDAGAGDPPGLDAPPIPALRRDHESSHLLALIVCTIGQLMLMLIDVRRDGVGTLRTPTIVLDPRELGTAQT